MHVCQKKWPSNQAKEREEEKDSEIKVDQDQTTSHTITDHPQIMNVSSSSTKVEKKIKSNRTHECLINFNKSGENKIQQNSNQSKDRQNKPPKTKRQSLQIKARTNLCVKIYLQQHHNSTHTTQQSVNIMCANIEHGWSTSNLTK